MAEAYDLGQVSPRWRSSRVALIRECAHIGSTMVFAITMVLQPDLLVSRFDSHAQAVQVANSM